VARPPKLSSLHPACAGRDGRKPIRPLGPGGFFRSSGFPFRDAVPASSWVLAGVVDSVCAWGAVGTHVWLGVAVSRLPARVGSEKSMPQIHPMPDSARDAAVATFVQIVRERNPGVRVATLTNVGADGAVVATAAGKIVRPFASPEDRDAVLDGDAVVPSGDDHGVDRAAEDALALLDR